MKYLITGGAGFIGSHLVNELISNNEVVVLDNFNTGKWENLPLKHKNLLIFGGSITDSNLEFLFDGVDIVFHLAALTRPQWSIEHPIEADHTNVNGTLNILKYAKGAKVKRVVFASSSSLYGIPTKFPTPETEPSRAMSPYGLQKYLAEQYCWLFERMYKLEVNCIRPFNVYGTRQNLNGGYAPAVPNFINQLSQNLPGEITGNGEQTRDFTYVKDIVDLFLLASETPIHGQSFNGGYGESISINYVYRVISEALNKNIKPIYVDALYEPQKTLADNSKARAIGWKPKFNFKSGIKDML